MTDQKLFLKLSKLCSELANKHDSTILERLNIILEEILKLKENHATIEPTLQSNSLTPRLGKISNKYLILSIILQSTYCIEEALHRLYNINKGYREAIAIRMYG